MKQAEHPPVTAGASIAAEYSLAIIDRLARIDRTCSKEEMDELVYRLLSLIGEAMQSDRVFLFERLEGTAEAYCNTFEWCAPIGCSRRKRAFKSCWTSAAWMRS